MAISLAHRARLAAQRRLGVDVQRYPQSHPLWNISQFLKAERIDTVLDIGANDGGFASDLRALGYEGTIHSFEPLSGPYRLLESRSKSDDFWFTHRLAIGSRAEEITINVAGNSGASSSVLPMLDSHAVVVPESAYVGKETVQQSTLDSFIDTLGAERRIYVKVDVQGYEREVLAAGESALATRIHALQMEASLVPLYEGSWSWREAVSHMDERGFSVVGIYPGFTDLSAGRVLQCDFVFTR